MSEQTEYKLKQFRMLLKDWMIGNTEDRKVLDFILNYGLSKEFKQAEETVRELYGEDIQKKKVGIWDNLKDVI